MKVKILKETVVHKTQVKPGKVVDVSEAEARLLIGLGKAEPAEKGKRVERATGAGQK